MSQSRPHRQNPYGGDLRPHESIGTCKVAELAILVGSPRPDRAVTLHGNRMVSPRRTGHDAGQPGNLLGG